VPAIHSKHSARASMVASDAGRPDAPPSARESPCVAAGSPHSHLPDPPQPRRMNNRFDSTSRPRRSFSTRKHRDAEADGDRHVPREHRVTNKDSCRLDGRSPATARSPPSWCQRDPHRRTAENPCPLGEGANQPSDGLVRPNGHQARRPSTAITCRTTSVTMERLAPFSNG